MISRAVYNPLNGRLTAGAAGSFSYEVAKTEEDSNHWCVTENNRNNARYVSFLSGFADTYGKFNGLVIRPVAAFGGYVVPEDFINSVWDAYYDCLRGKSRSEQAVEYMQIAAEDIPKLAYELWANTYKPGTSTCFLVRYPKLREVFAAGFRDRIIHHWVCLRLEPLFEERFVAQGNVSFNCRKGFGTEAAVNYVAEGMRRVSDNYHKPAWVFRGDLVGFFMSIDKQRLWYRLQRFIVRRYHGTYKDILLRTTRIIVMHRPERDCVLNSPVSWWHGLAPNKSLFTTETGMPIGNLTTQLFANFFMSYFILYVLWLYRRKNYIVAQFVDDFVIVCDDLRFLVDSIPKIEAFFRDKLGLTLHRDKRYLQPVSHGVLFVGTYIKPCRLYLSNRTLARMKERCEGYGKMMAEKECDHLDLSRIEQVLNSYMGFCLRRETYQYRKDCIELLGPEFWIYFMVMGHYNTIRPKNKCSLTFKI